MDKEPKFKEQDYIEYRNEWDNLQTSPVTEVCARFKKDGRVKYYFYRTRNSRFDIREKKAKLICRAENREDRRDGK